ncbi:MAG: hypothetical protein J6O61_06855 [Butyrivibrio sp.]|uniref:hypothetical protein n=1 Tax=Butyrivibrio sp. TaxID=28121 RepID=UPI001B2EEC61|nr:hypothetical protein [Butyrivibrio sp.]MBO6240536.1 hypothetical protein [Butyrivibrio sp.]
MFSEEVKNQLLEMARAVDSMTEVYTNSMMKFIESDGFKNLIEVFKNLPKDAHDTELFQRTKELEKKEISYEDVCWLREVVGSQPVVDNCKTKEYQSTTAEYVSKIINSKEIGKREKIVVLLSNAESLIYEKMNHTRVPYDSVKKVAGNHVDEKHEMNKESFDTIIVTAICFVVFSNTDNYSFIDKRIPFRNNILHKGTVTYSDEEISEAYDILEDYMLFLIR